MAQHIGWKRGEENTEFDEFGTEHIVSGVDLQLPLTVALYTGKSYICRHSWVAADSAGASLSEL